MASIRRGFYLVFKKLIYLFIHLWPMAVAVHVPSCAVGHSFQKIFLFWWLLCCDRALATWASAVTALGSVVMAHGLNCSGSVDFLDQGLKPCPLHWQADFATTDHQELQGQILAILKPILKAVDNQNLFSLSPSLSVCGYTSTR